ncbi:protein virilizer homolog [Liolophura sinensis]|uniref:protein virilizer homolog n=1 Tax=Liolophura sinensis TaxID=3198878 RepID=UPI0031595284
MVLVAAPAWCSAMRAKLRESFLFFDTFSHENTEELNLDLVQFPRPVLVQEVRVIPLGTRVQVNVPGGERLGATNPSSFKLEFFINNLSKPNSAVFEKLGILDYKKNVEIQFLPPENLPTDGLILKGWYTTITLAVYGTLTTVTKDRNSPPPPPPPQQPASRSKAIEGRATEWEPPRDPPREPRQHPLDFITQISQQALQQPHTPASHPTQPLSTSPRPDLYPALSSEHSPAPRDTTQEYGRQASDFSTDTRERDSQREMRDVSAPREPHRDYRGPPEPREPYTSPYYEERRSKDFDRPYYRERRDSQSSRDSDYGRDIHSSREGSREPREFRGSSRDSRDFRERDSDRDWDHNRDRDLDRSRSHETDRETGKEFPDKEPSDRLRTPPPRRMTPPRSVSRSRSRSRSRSPIRRSPPRRSPARRSPVRRSLSPAPESIKPRDVPVEDQPETGELEDRDIGMFEQLTPEHSPNEQLYLSDGELQGQEEDPYEAISSDEDMGIADLEADITADIGYYDDDSWNFAMSSFNPFQCDLAPLDTFTDPSLTKYEVEAQKWEQMSSSEIEGPPKTATDLIDIYTTFQDSDHHDKWVEALEEVPLMLTEGLSYLLHREDRNDILDALVEWTMEGLDLSKAIDQPETVFKVRHLKMGIKLCGSLASCDPSISNKLISRNVQHILLDLYEAPSMSVSLKVQIVRALDQTTRFKEGIDWLLGKQDLQTEAESDANVENGHGTEVRSAPVSETGQKATVYQRLLEIVMSKQTVRCVVAITALMRKIHLYAVMKRLNQATEHVVKHMSNSDDQHRDTTQKASVVENMSTEEEVSKPGEGGDGGDMDMESGLGGNLNESDVETLAMCLEEVTKALVLAPDMIGQPKRALPRTSLFEVSHAPYDPYSNLYHMFHACRLLECLFILMSSPATFNHPSLFSAIKDLFQQFLETQNGLLFLSSRPETTNGIIRSLTQTADFSREESAEDIPTQQLGMELIYYLQTLQYIDQLRHYNQKGSSEKDIDDAEPLGILHSLYTMTFSPLGQDAVVHVFSLEDNLGLLLPFIETSGSDERDCRLKKSVCAGYTAELLLLIIKNCEKVSVLEKYSSKLLTLTDQDVSSKILELQDWLAPTKKITVYSYEGLEPVIELLKQYNEDISKLPRGLVTTLRVLTHLAIPVENPFQEESRQELKYLYVIVELYGKDCLPDLLNILQKLTELMLRPWQQGVPQSTNQMLYLLSVIRPALSLVKAIVSQVIMARGSQFKDLTALPTLFELHTLLCSLPVAGVFGEDIAKVQRDVIDCLLAYTQPALQQAQSDEALSQSLWTQCVKEALKYTVTTPYAYYGGLLMISELLPLPLPLQTRERLTDEEKMLVVNSRKLWSAHLHPLTSHLLEVLRIIAGSTCQPLQQILRRVCLQLADLAAPTAAMIVRCIVDVVMESMALPDDEVNADPRDVEMKEKEATPPNDVAPPPRPASTQTTQILDLLANLSSQPPIKASFLQLVRESKDDDKYAVFLTQLLHLLTTASPRSSHIHSQECVVSLIQNLCDVEVTMMSADGNTTVQDQLANALPDKESMTAIALALLEHVGNADNSYASIHPCLRTLVMLTDHDYGFYYLKCALEKSRFSLYNLIMRISNTFSKDSSDILSTLSTIIELLRLLVIPDAPDDNQPQTRIQHLTNKELREALAWEKDSKNHPLNELDKLLVECSKDEEALQTLQETISSLILIIGKKDEEPKPVLEPELPSADDLATQFETRATFVLTDMDDDRLSPTYWLANPVTEDLEQDVDMVKSDFLDLCSRYCHDFDLEGELKRATSCVIEDTEVTRPRKLRERRKQDTINTSRGRGGKRPFVAPMRGRGIARGMMHTGRTDSFRCRPPNTSRPPSMHVDDFVKMETHQKTLNQPGAPQRRPDKEGGRGRGRGGFGGGFERGGGFGGKRGGNGRGGGGGGRGLFTPPLNYGRREGDYFQGNQRGGRPKSNFTSPRSFGRGGHDGRPGSADRRMGGGRGKPVWWSRWPRRTLGRAQRQR